MIGLCIRPDPEPISSVLKGHQNAGLGLDSVDKIGINDLHFSHYGWHLSNLRSWLCCIPARTSLRSLSAQRFELILSLRRGSLGFLQTSFGSLTPRWVDKSFHVGKLPLMLPLIGITNVHCI